MAIFQKFNKRIGAWVRIRKYADGSTKILQVKKFQPTVAFAGVTKK